MQGYSWPLASSATFTLTFLFGQITIQYTLEAGMNDKEKALIEAKAVVFKALGHPTRLWMAE
jgi:hypothetical protein